jgi:hypothetical protein
MNDRDGELPVEDFIQALTSQLDRAQEGMAVKAHNARLPLTFALKDLTLELRAHVDVAGSVVRIRPAGPGERETSVLNIQLTTITKPQLDENARILETRPDEPTLKEALGGEISDEERRRLEWAGLRTVSQLRRLEREGGESLVERVSQLPVERLRRALSRVASPRVRQVRQVPGPDPGMSMLRITGDNLMRDDAPEVRIGGAVAPIVEAGESELLVGPLAGQLGDTLAIETGPGYRTETPWSPAPIPNGQPSGQPAGGHGP